MIHPTTPPAESVTAAFARADEQEWWRLVAWQPDRQHWLVPSRSEPGRYYIVSRRPGASKGNWWDVLDCDCPTGTVHARRVCWHRAAVTRYLHHRRALLPSPGFR